jgi:hypothetical protein
MGTVIETGLNLAAIKQHREAEGLDDLPDYLLQGIAAQIRHHFNAVYNSAKPPRKIGPLQYPPDRTRIR